MAVDQDAAGLACFFLLAGRPNIAQEVVQILRTWKSLVITDKFEAQQVIKYRLTVT
jgi:hypothetical protein